MPNSQNGWPIVGEEKIIDRAILGVRFPHGWLEGDVNIIFTYLVNRLNAEVERIDNGSCWAYNVRKIEGSDDWSNHSSGTAFDYNAPNHPVGKRNTYSESDQDKIHAILDDLDGVVRWGGDYTGRPDDMHFEIYASASEVKRVADRLRVQKKWVMEKLDGLGLPVLEFGMDDADYEGWDVIERMQRIVGAEPDGNFGPQTRTRLKAWGLNGDRVGLAEWKRLYGLTWVG